MGLIITTNKIHNFEHLPSINPAPDCAHMANISHDYVTEGLDTWCQNCGMYKSCFECISLCNALIEIYEKKIKQTLAKLWKE